MRQLRNRVRPLTGSLAAAAALLLALSAAPARAAVVERFDADPLAPGGPVPFFGDGDVASHFAWLPDEPPHFPGDRSGTLRVLYDTTLPAGRIATPLGQVLSLDEDASFGAILTIRPEGYLATPEGFDQIAFGLWNSRTTGLNRTGFPSDSFDLVEFDYFANISPDFGGPFLSPTIFGGDVADNAYFNFTFQSSQVPLPLGVPLLCELTYSASMRQLTTTVSRIDSGIFFKAIPMGSVTVDLAAINPTYLVDSLGIAAYTEGLPSLHAVVDYDLLYAGRLPIPFGIAGRRAALGGRTSVGPRATPRATPTSAAARSRPPQSP